MSNVDITSSWPVITLDGPSGCGKSTVSRLLAKRYGWQLLDSGALYRILAWQSLAKNTTDLSLLGHFFQKHAIRFLPDESGCNTLIYIDDNRFDEHLIRTPDIGQLASKMAEKDEVRQQLLVIQRRYANYGPGLVTEGRDMGSVIFPHATLKVYMIADDETRNQRRFHQLQAMGQSVSIDELKANMAMRDQRDMNRRNAPLLMAENARCLDTSHMQLAEVVATIDQWYQNQD